MENFSFFKKGISVAHLPTLMLVIGYPVYWLELYVFDSRNGSTSPLATVLFLLIAGAIFYSQRLSWGHEVKELKSAGKDGWEKIFIISAALLTVGLLSVALYASLLPPHLMQEYDALNYHYAIPRQHLILDSFKHIAWSSADLFPLPIQFALAPFWFVTELPNKFPQFLFFIGLLLVSADLIKRLNGRPLSALLVAAAILGTHSIGIQMGMAILDLIICYLFLAAIDSFLKGAIGMAAIEFTFFFWSKSFVPPQILCIVSVMGCLYAVFHKFGFNVLTWDFKESIGKIEREQLFVQVQKFGRLFLILSVFIGAPFVVKSFYYSGTPLYPLAAGKLPPLDLQIDQNSPAWRSLLNAAQDHMGARNAYGEGRSPLAFIKHFWLIAVPDKGVNNAFDYPLGLPYVLLIGPFFWLLMESFRGKEFPLMPWFVVVYWILWWFGSQQSRFLYIPLCLSYIAVLSAQKDFSKVLLAVLVLAMGLNFLSVLRANKADFGLGREEVLRKNDLQIVAKNKKYVQEGDRILVPWENQEVAFAQFPVIVVPERLPYVLAVDPNKIKIHIGK